MAATLDDLSNEALVLPPDERVTLAYRLLVSVEPEPALDADEAWAAKITQRIANFDAGKAQTVSGTDVFSSLREIAP